MVKSEITKVISLEEVGEITIKKLTKRSLKEILDNIIEAKGDYNRKIQENISKQIQKLNIRNYIDENKNRQMRRREGQAFCSIDIKRF